MGIPPTIHEERFMARAPRKPADKTATTTLNGSSTLPSEIDLGDERTITLSDLVEKTHAQSGLTVEEWNLLDEDDRDARLEAFAESMRTPAGAQPTAEPARTIKDKPYKVRNPRDGTDHLVYAQTQAGAIRAVREHLDGGEKWTADLAGGMDLYKAAKNGTKILNMPEDDAAETQTDSD